MKRRLHLALLISAGLMLNSCSGQVSYAAEEVTQAFCDSRAAEEDQGDLTELSAEDAPADE